MPNKSDVLERQTDRLLDRVLIVKAAKANPELSYTALGELLGKPEWTVRRTLKLQEHTPKELLQSLEYDAVKAWKTALPIAGAKGDHRPAKDLLLHTKAIQPVADAGHAGITVLIGSVVLPGAVLPQSGNGIEVMANDSEVIDASVTDALPAASAEENAGLTVAPGAPDPVRAKE